MRVLASRRALLVTLVHEVSVSSWFLAGSPSRLTSCWLWSTSTSAPRALNLFDVCNFMLLARKRGSLSLLHVTSFLIRVFFVRIRSFHTCPGFLIIQSRCINDHALNNFTLQRLTLVLSLLTGWHPHVQSQKSSVVSRQSCVLFSNGLYSWFTFQRVGPNIIPCPVGSVSTFILQHLLLRRYLSFTEPFVLSPLPSSCQCPSSSTPPHDVHTAHYGNIALEPVPLPLPFTTFRSDSSLSRVSPVSSSL